LRASSAIGASKKNRRGKTTKQVGGLFGAKGRNRGKKRLRGRETFSSGNVCSKPEAERLFNRGDWAAKAKTPKIEKHLVVDTLSGDA